jgi:hypothetical protein
MVATLRQQVDTLTADNRRLGREKQLAEAMKFAQESKFEALEEKLAKSQGECATLQRQLATAAKKQGGQAEEIAQQMVEMRDELEQLKGQRQEEVSRAEALQSENVALRARARTYDAFPGLGAPSPRVQAMEMVAEAAEEAGGMSLADEMGMSLADQVEGDEDEEDAPEEAPPKQDQPPEATGSVAEAKRLAEAEHQADRLAGLVHFLQEDNVRLTQEQALIAGEFLRLSTVVSERASASKGSESGPMAPVKKAGWLMKRNPRAVAGKFKWKRRYFVLDGARLRYFENAASTAASGHINLERYDLHAAKSLSKRLGKNHAFELNWVGDSADASTRLKSCPASKLAMMSGGAVEAAGMLQSEGKRNNSFQSRWFVLVRGKEDESETDPEFEAKRYLLTYEASTSESAKSCVCLRDGAYECGTPKKERKDFKQDQVIRLDIKTSGTESIKLVLATASASEMQKWRPALERLDHKHGGETNTKTGGDKVSTYNLMGGSGKTVMPSDDSRGDYCLAAENGEELSDWVEAITKAMAAAELAALDDDGGADGEVEEDPALKVDSKVLDLARDSTRGGSAGLEEDVAAASTPPPEAVEQPLPEGWAKHPSKEYPGRFFYLHGATNVSQWERPRARNLTQDPDDLGATTWTVEQKQQQQQEQGAEESGEAAGEGTADAGAADTGRYSAVSLSVTAEGVEIRPVGGAGAGAGSSLAEADWAEITAWNVLGEEGIRIELGPADDAADDADAAAAAGGAEAGAARQWEFRTKDAGAIGLAMASASEEMAEVAI